MLTDELDAALARPSTPLLDHRLRLLAIEAELTAKPSLWARLGRRGVAVGVLVLLLAGGGATAATAGQEAWRVMFPPAVSKTFTFSDGVTCTVAAKVRPDFVTSRKPQDAVVAANKYLETLDVSTLPLEQALKDVVPSSFTEHDPDKHVPEMMAANNALGDAIFAELVRQGYSDKGYAAGVSIEGRSDCK